MTVWILLITLHFLWTGDSKELPSIDAPSEQWCKEQGPKEAERFNQDGVEADAYCVAVYIPAGIDV
jgi:hypothetical protein